MAVTQAPSQYLAPNRPTLVRDLPVDQIQPSRLNPRKHFDQAALEELAADIREHGVLEPIVVRTTSWPAIDDEKVAKAVRFSMLGMDHLRRMADINLERVIAAGGKGHVETPYNTHEWEVIREAWRARALELGYHAVFGETIERHPLYPSRATCQLFPANAPLYEIIAGERRWRASQIAGMQTIPARILEDVDDAAALRFALIENLQRVDLDPIEEAEGYRQLNKVCGLKQAEIAAAVKRSQPTLANAMRLLDLPEDIQERIRRRELSVSHGVALAKYKDFPELVSKLATLAVEHHWTSGDLEDEAILNNWTVRETGLIELIGHQAFTANCAEHCAFNAYRKSKQYRNYGYCLKPEHYRELEAAYDAERLARAEAAKAAAVAAAKAPPRANPTPTTEEKRTMPAPEGRPDWVRMPPNDRPPVWQKVWAGYLLRVEAVGDGTLRGFVTVPGGGVGDGPDGPFEKLVDAQLAVERFAHERYGAPAPDDSTESAELPKPDSPTASLPRLADLLDRKYERLDYSWSKPPEGCSEACPCRGAALDDKGNIVPICTRPGRLTWLRSQQTKRETQERQKDAAAKMLAMLSQVERLDDIAAQPAELAILVAAALRKGEYSTLRRDDLRKVHVPDLDLYARDPKDFMDVAVSNPVGLVRYVVAAILADELNTYHDSGGPHPWAKWYLRWNGLMESVEQEQAPPSDALAPQSDANTEDDGAERCMECGRKLSDAEIEEGEPFCFDCLGDEDEEEEG